jgi:four helix bundle protein
MRQLTTLDAWRVSRVLAIEAYRITLRAPLKSHVGLANQVRRSAISVPANVAEAYALGTKRQIIRGVRIALASAAELRTHIDVAHELRLVTGEDATLLLSQCDRVLALLVGYLKKLGATLPA